MGSYEIIVKTEELRRKSQEGDYRSAQRILDTIDLKKVKNISDLSLMAEVFTQNERYDDAMELLKRVYQKNKTRKTLYQMVWTSIKTCNTDEADQYLKEYEALAPKDFYKYIFRYSIDKIKGAPYETLIESLQTLKNTEYIEQWAYELAKLYYKAGMEEECIRECSDIILWFGEGSYVEKAKILKAYYSGEADKDMIIEELKKRAAQENNSEVDKNQEDTQEEYTEEYPTDGTDRSETIKIDSVEDEEQEEIAVSMKKEVQDILSEDFHQEEECSNGVEESQEEAFDNKTSEMEDIHLLNIGLEETLTERDRMEQEVEEELYRLLEEEDEDSRSLAQLSEELEIDLFDIFGNFLHVKTIRRQLVKSIESILDKHTKSVQLIITGDHGSGKTTLAKDISVFLYKVGKLNSPRVAKISADKLNSIDIMEKKETLRDCCIMIEDASKLKRPSIDRLLELIKYFHGDIAVIFEENKKNMNQLFRECPKLMDLFKNRIHLPHYTDEEYLGFAYSGIKRKEYKLIKGARLVLVDSVNKITKKSEAHDKLQMIDKLIQDAMKASDVRTGKQLSDLAASGRLGEAEILTILPEDFNT